MTSAADPTASPRAPAVAALKSRIAAAVLVTAAFAALAWADQTALGGAAPVWWLLPAAIVVAFGGADEAVKLFAQRGVALPGLPVKLLAAAVACSAAVAGTAAPAAAAMGWPALAVAAAAIVLSALEVCRYRGGDEGTLDRLSAGILVVVILGLPLACMASLRLLGAATNAVAGGLLPLVSLIAVAKAGDIAAYVGGTLLGRHRMAPLLSPGKTWEGAAASIAGSSFMAWLLLDRLAGPQSTGPWGGWPLYGLAVGAAAILGDLAESLFKRECGAKDSGRSLGAMGGLLDLVDSLLFAAPVAWGLWVLGG
ncbi:MAG: Phosphatidate cytidylyltransferase [Planctomycetota bacterium]